VTDRTYLDWNATAPIRPAAVEAVSGALRHVGNASSVHAFGRAARSRVEAARDHVAALVGAKARDVVFTGSGTEANNTVLGLDGWARVVVSAIEHDSVRLAHPGAEVAAVLPSGVIDLEALARQLRRTPVPTLVSVMLANNETGALQPVADVVRLARAAGAHVHCDAVQAAGRTHIDFDGLGLDYLTLSAHKLGGPQGVGALVVREGVPFAAAQVGGGQERGRRAGTENVAGIAGFGAAAHEALSELAGMDRLRALRDRFEAASLQVAPDACVFASGAPRLANTSCIAMPGVPAQTQLMAFDLAGIAVSSGAACSSGKVRSSHVLAAMGVEPRTADEAIRVSIGSTTTDADVSRLIAVWRDLCVKLGRLPLSAAAAA
jgi:cysteine desulfurase